MAKHKAKKSKSRKTRSPAQKAATKRMLAANKRKGGSHKGKRRSRARHPAGGVTIKGYPKALLRKHAHKLDAVLKANHMGGVHLTK
jgi:hypothetical protein